MTKKHRKSLRRSAGTSPAAHRWMVAGAIAAISHPSVSAAARQPAQRVRSLARRGGRRSFFLPRRSGLSVGSRVVVERSCSPATRFGWPAPTASSSRIRRPPPTASRPRRASASTSPAGGSPPCSRPTRRRPESRSSSPRPLWARSSRWVWSEPTRPTKRSTASSAAPAPSITSSTRRTPASRCASP